MRDLNRRGCTDEIPPKFNISVKEVRLMSYLSYLLQNSMPVDPRKILPEERHILQKWRDEGKITFSMSEPCTATKEFWMEMCEILFYSYVLEKENTVQIKHNA